MIITALYEPVTTRCCFSIPSENIRKPSSFLFSRGLEEQHGVVMG